MSQGFYELLGVQPGNSTEEIRQAFQGRLAALVRRLKAARKQGADVSLLESQERNLREAMEVLADPARRRRYDSFRDISERETPPADASELWQQCRGSLMEPAAVSALNAVRALTDLPIGEPIPGLPSRDALKTGRKKPLPAPTLPPTLPPVAAAPAPAPANVTQLPPPLQMRPPSIAIGQPPGINMGMGMGMGMPTPREDEDERPTTPTTTDDDGSKTAATFSMRPHIAMPSLPPAPPPEEEPTVEILARRFGYDGRFLRGVRELRGMSLEALSRATRISLRYLEALETNAFDRLPTRVFVRGYVREIARELDLEDTEIVERYLALFDHHGG